MNYPNVIARLLLFVIGLVAWWLCYAGPAACSSKNTIRHEVVAAFGVTHVSEETEYEERSYDRGPDSDGSSLDVLSDTLHGALGYRHYFNARFTDPDVPFAFVPYNYRSNTLEGAFEVARSKFTLKSQRTSAESGCSRRWYRLGTQTVHHFETFFVAGSIAYSRWLDACDESETAKVGSYGGLCQEACGSRDVRATFGGGWLDEKAKVGAKLRVGRLYDQQATELSDQSFVGVTPFAEVTPSPYFRFAASITLWDAVSHGDYWEMRIPAAVSIVFPEHWWELGLEGWYWLNEREAEVLGVSGVVRKYLGDGSIHVSAAYANRQTEEEGLEPEAQNWRFGLGGDLVLQSRLQLSVGYSLETGDPVIRFNKGHWGHTVQAVVRVFR